MAFEDYVEVYLDADTYRGRDYCVVVIDLAGEIPKQLGYISSSMSFVEVPDEPKEQLS